MLQAGFDYLYNGLEMYIANATSFLEPAGKLLLGTGNFADHSKIDRLCKKYKYKPVKIQSFVMPLTLQGRVLNEYYILELKDIRK